MSLRNPPGGRSGRARAPRTTRGFTLLETGMAIIVIAVGILAFIDSQGTFVRTNRWSSQSATGAYLANEIRELLRNLPRHDPVVGLPLDDGGQVVGWGPNFDDEILVQEVPVTPGSTTHTKRVIGYNDIDDFDEQSFGLGGTFPGPINAKGYVIPQVGADGAVVVQGGTGSDLEEPLEGWAQLVTVEKLDPFNYAAAPVTDAYVDTALGWKVDEFPLRVTVRVTYQGPYDDQPLEVAKLVWVVPGVR